MCLFGSSDTKTKSTTSLDKQTTAAKTAALTKATALSNKLYTPTPTDSRVAGFSDDTAQGFQQVRNNALNYNPTNVNSAISSAQQYGAAPAQSVKVEGLMDESGRLGTVQSYMDPYLKQVLDPALRQINEQGAIQRNGISANATSAGAFGDARHGIVEGAQMRDEGQQVADTTGQLYSSAYGDAMSRRQNDQQAFANQDLTNANFRETALGRMLQGGQTTMDMEAADQVMKGNRAQSLLTSGASQQAMIQKRMDAAQEEKLRADESQYRGLDTLLAFLNGAPTAQTVTSSANDGSNGLTKVLGGALGAFL